MSLYEFYQHEKNFCEHMAAQNHIDNALCTFYARAARGFEIKMNNLTLAEASK